MLHLLKEKQMKLALYNAHIVLLNSFITNPRAAFNGCREQKSSKKKIIQKGFNHRYKDHHDRLAEILE